jgi:hypothetical protein
MRQDKMTRKLARERLFLRLNKLAGCCKAQDTPWPGTIWPDEAFLRSLEEDVMLLIATERKNPPSPAWKAFQLLDRRMPKLLLVKRVDSLVKRAQDRLEEAAQHPLSKLEQQAECGDENARKLLRDIAAIRDGQDAAKKIHWTEHERALAQFSRTRSVEPSYGRSAPPEFRCYARALELIVDHYRRKPLRSWPLTEWTARIGHPGAKSLLQFDDPTGFIIEEAAWRGESAFRRREKVRERVRRHREWKNEACIYPGDWLRHSHKKPLPAWAKVNPDACCDLCGRCVSAGDYWYIQRTDNQRARCSDCQSVIWELDGYEVIYPSGFPCGDWGKPSDLKKPDLKHDAARYAEAVREVLGDKYVPERIKEILAADQTKAG